MEGTMIPGAQIFNTIILVLVASCGQREAPDPNEGSRLSTQADGLPQPSVESSRELSLLPERPPATEAAQRVMETIERLEREVVSTEYRYVTVIDEHRGVYHWDCSTMTTWVLHRAAPTAQATIDRSRPVARDFHHLLNRSPGDQQRDGWRRILRVDELSPGDLFAWLVPPGTRRDITGHVGFAIARPQPHPTIRDLWVLRIADSARRPHGDDTRLTDGKGGFGYGTIVFEVDERGRPVAYGWDGTEPRPHLVETSIVLGRVSR